MVELTPEGSQFNANNDSEKTMLVNQFSSSRCEVYETFEAMSLNKNLLRGIHEYGLKNPSEIQQKAIVPFCTGQNVIQLTEYDPGKSTTYCIGILQQLDISLTKCQCIILTSQFYCLGGEIAHELMTIGRYLDVRVRRVGFGRYDDDITDVHILVGSPTDVQEWVEKKSYCLDHVKIFVLAEANKISSLEVVKSSQVFECLPLRGENKVQVGIFSESMAKEISDVAVKCMKNPLLIEGKKPSQLSVEAIKNHLFVRAYNDNSKAMLLEELCKELRHQDLSQPQKIIVFVDTFRRVDRVRKLMEEIYDRKFLATRQKMDQKDRDHMKDEFLVNGVLITDEVFARGIDVEHVDLIINFDMPIDYLKRVGQFKEVSIVNFATTEDWFNMFDFQTELDVVFEEHMIFEPIMPLLKETPVKRDETNLEEGVKQFLCNGYLEDAKFESFVFLIKENLAIVPTVFFVDTCESVIQLSRELKKVLTKRKCRVTTTKKEYGLEDLVLTFADGYESRVLIITDEKSLLIDVKKVPCVVHYNIPLTVDLYKHRIGWCETKGVIIYVPTDSDWSMVFEAQASFKVVVKWFTGDVKYVFNQLMRSTLSSEPRPIEADDRKKMRLE
ncbi:RNA helicase [Ranunculus cassubicifolius]